MVQYNNIRKINGGQFLRPWERFDPLFGPWGRFD